MKNQTVRQIALLPKLDATGLDANMGLKGTTMTAPVVKSATAQSHVMDLSVHREPLARWELFLNENSENLDEHLRWSRIRLEGRRCTKQFAKTTPRRGFVLKWTGTNTPTAMPSATQVLHCKFSRRMMSAITFQHLDLEDWKFVLVDGDCSGEQKCCYNGCGKSCMKVSAKSQWKIIVLKTFVDANKHSNIQTLGDPGRGARLWWQLCRSSQSQRANSWGERSIWLTLMLCGRNKTTITNSQKVVETPVIVPEGDIATLRIRVSGNPT